MARSPSQLRRIAGRVGRRCCTTPAPAFGGAPRTKASSFRRATSSCSLHFEPSGKLRAPAFRRRNSHQGWARWAADDGVDSGSASQRNDMGSREGKTRTRRDPRVGGRARGSRRNGYRYELQRAFARGGHSLWVHGPGQPAAAQERSPVPSRSGRAISRRFSAVRTRRDRHGSLVHTRRCGERGDTQQSQAVDSPCAPDAHRSLAPANSRAISAIRSACQSM